MRQTPADPVALARLRALLDTGMAPATALAALARGYETRTRSVDSGTRLTGAPLSRLARPGRTRPGVATTAR